MFTYDLRIQFPRIPYDPVMITGSCPDRLLKARNAGPRHTQTRKTQQHPLKHDNAQHHPTSTHPPHTNADEHPKSRTRPRSTMYHANCNCDREQVSNSNSASRQITSMTTKHCFTQKQMQFASPNIWNYRCADGSNHQFIKSLDCVKTSPNHL